MDDSKPRFADIQPWAEQLFPAAFRRLPHHTHCTVTRHRVRNVGATPSHGQLVVGTTLDPAGRPVDLLAWCNGFAVSTGYLKSVHGSPEIHFQDVLDARIRFYPPFSSVLRSWDEQALVCFEALVRYYLLARRGKDHLRLATHPAGALEAFKTGFRGACERVDACALKEEEDKWRSGHGSKSGSAKSAYIAHTAYTPVKLESATTEEYQTPSHIIVFPSPSPSPPPSPTPLLPRKRKRTCSNGATPSNRTSSKKQKPLEDPLASKVRHLTRELKMAQNRTLEANKQAELWKARYEKAMQEAQGRTEIGQTEAQAGSDGEETCKERACKRRKGTVRNPIRLY